MPTPAKRRLLLIGWDAADWKVIQPLLDTGWMPNLSRLIERGIVGNLATIQPILSPMLWSSIATGKRPYKHGVLGFSEIIPETGDIRPVSSLSRKSKALWNILHQEGKKCHVVGWWPSHPVEKLRGGMVSNHYHVATGDLDQHWPMSPGTVHPPEEQEALAALRVHPHELEGEILRAFVPRAPEIDQKKDKRLGMLAKLISECSSIHAAATYLLSTDPDWDFAAVYYDAIDHFSHGFMRYHPPKLDWVAQEDFDLYSQVLGGAYIYHDAMLGALLSLAGEETTVLLISDHGFHPDNLRPKQLPNEPAGPAAEHRPYGIFVAAGPGIKEDALLHSASILDVAPTILSLYGLPIGRDMDGRVLTAINKEEPGVGYIDSWDAVEGDDAMHSGREVSDSHSSAAVLKQLADLGYIDAPPESKQEGIDQTVREERYNLARALDDGGRSDEAAAIFAELWECWPEESRFGVHLLQVQIRSMQPVEARATMTLLKERKKLAVGKAMTELKELTATLRKEQGLPENPPEISTGNEAFDWEKVSEPHQRKYNKLRQQAGTNLHTFAFLEGSLLAAEGRWSESLAALEKVSGVQSSQVPSLHLKRGEVLMALRRPGDAAVEYAKTLELDPVNPAARFGLARVALLKRDFARAADEARAAIGCRHEFPQAHLIAGIALWRNGDPETAEGYLRGAVTINPVFPAGQRILASFLQHEKHDSTSALEHRRLARESRKRLRAWKAGIRPDGEHLVEYRAAFGRKAELNRREELQPFLTPATECVVVVSGLPRSGTSMMMQMIHAGGFPILVDDQRLADESNPKGYLEFEPAKRLLTDHSWLINATGKAVKLVSPLLPHLPRKSVKYRIILMQRPVREIVASQRAMLARDGREGSRVGDESLAAIYERQAVTTRTLLAHLQFHGEAEVMEVSYHGALKDPSAVSTRLTAFLGEGFDAEASTQAVDPALYRSKV